MGIARCVALLVCWAAVLGGCRLPPERNPPPALSAPAVVSVVLSEKHRLTPAIRLAAQRLNESRAPSERPVRLEIGPAATTGVVLIPITGDVSADARGLILVPRSGALPPEHRIDPAFPTELLADDVLTAHALAVYDAVLLGGMAARQGPDGTAELLLTRLRSAGPRRVALGEVDYRTTLEPTLGPKAVVRGGRP